MNKLERAGLCLWMLFAMFCVGYLAGRTIDQASEIDGLRARVRASELMYHEWRGELETLREIGVEVVVHDDMSRYQIEYVQAYLEHQQKGD